ncbi:LOW QUALITY PROTEIN: interferon-induced very large GTPase 1-like [Leptodactylus fuscus]
MSGQHNESEESQPDIQLNSRLEENGLDPGYWLHEIKELGITNVQALQYVRADDCSSLENKIRYPWEKRALWKLFGIPESGTKIAEVQEKQAQVLKERNEEASKILKQLKVLRSESKSFQDEVVSRKVEEMQKLLEIPTESSVPPDKTLGELMDYFEKQNSLRLEASSKTDHFTDEEVIKNSSGGLALEGIFCTKDREEYFKKRKTLICVPEDFRLLSPEESPCFIQKEFTSHEEELHFIKRIEKVGLSLSMSIGFSITGFGLSYGINRSTSSTSEVSTSSSNDHTYISTTRYNYVPLASYYFTKNQLRLSQNALSELKEIEKLIRMNSDTQIVRSKCKDFFQIFGSHASLGPIHFGGIFWWKASMDGVHKNKIHEAKTSTIQALNFFMNCDHVGTASDADALYTDTCSFDAQIELSVTKTGGPLDADSLPHWKAGLVTSNKSWSVIDRGFQLTPIWNIIVNSHRNEFLDVIKLSSCLMDSYKSLTGLSSEMMVGEQLLTGFDETQVFLEGVKFWDPENAKTHLNDLLDIKRNINGFTESSSNWVNVCLSNKNLQNFLVNVAEKYKSDFSYDTDIIKALMQKLIEPHIYSAEDFPEASVLTTWIYNSQNDNLVHIDFREFSELKDVLQKSRNDIRYVTSARKSSNEVIHQTRLRTTLNISYSLYSFLRILRNTGQIEAELLILCIANNSGYCVENHSFQTLLGLKEIESLKDQLHEAYEEYRNVRKQCAVWAQALVLYTGLTFLGLYSEISSQKKRERLNFMTKHLRSSLFPDVEKILNQNSGNWEVIEDKLRALRNGYAIQEDIKVKDLVRQLSHLCQEKKTSTELPYVVGSSDTREDFLMLLKDLALEKYYPQKMKKSDFHTVSRAMLSGAQPSENGELPIYFLQKLLIMDYSARYVHCENKGEEPQPNTRTINDDNTFGSLGNRTQDFFRTKKIKITEKHIANQVQHIHPMDVQMAIFHCADDFMRQYIYNKLSFCQFALPMLVPDPNTKSIGFPLWAFQEVRKQWKTKHGDDTKKTKLNDTFIKDTAAPIVSFIRLGPSAFSKSQTMNWLMSKHRHDIFYHRHCEGSTKNSLLMDGVTEIAWYCPGGREDDVFDDCTAFLNLHGDARDHSPQLEFIQDISSVLVIVLTESDLEDSKSKTILDQLLDSTRPCVFLLVDEELSDSENPCKLKIGVKDKNKAKLTKEIGKKLQELLLLQKAMYSLNKCAARARSHGFVVDEDKVQCKVGKEQAETLLKLLKTKDLSARKNTFLPLQGDLWRQWCRKDKEMNRLGGKIQLSIEQQRSDIETKKEALRREQLKRAIPLNIFMKDFLQFLYSNEQGSKMYFLQWFKMYLDELSSEDLSVLYQKYYNVWSSVKEEKQEGKNKPSKDRREKELQELTNQFKLSIFGLEHVLRELGQIYEALEANTQDQVISNLPKIAANLMIWGYPIELMDGDAAYVPLKWITAILHELKETLGDKRLFVLSVLGIQSTGKSTLLNAMFGLQFAVSAGICTRGAFMQLVKVEEELQKKLNYDYVLVVDTEGLRSVQSSNKNEFNHDNELATFVIGLGNLTLINIFGENPSEMKDILQIAVQAFLRMKKVNLNPSCLFIHQNVGEITAKEKNMEGQRCLAKKLDEMTVYAAEQEECDVTCFNDVIKFDVRTHIHYFAHLWEGPPMAPPNTRYSQNVQTLRKVILDSEKVKDNMLNISAFSRRVTDLWKALLNENFVFSFKNSLEIAAYNQLEVKYSQWQWKLRERTLILQTEINNQVRKGERESIGVISINEKINEVYSAVQEDIKVFFDESKEKNILVQWRKNTEIRVKNLKDELIQEVKEKVNELISFAERNRKIDARKRKYEEKILVKSKDLALSLKGQNLNDENIEEKFTISWKCWISDVAGDVAPPHSPDIQGDLDKILLDYFKKEVNISNTIHESYKWENVTDEFYNFVSSKKNNLFMSETLSDGQKPKINHSVNVMKNHIDEYIDKKKHGKLDYQRSYFHEILEIIRKKIHTMFDEKFKFLSDYILYVSLFLCRKAARRFEKLSAAYRKANDPVAYLESKREEFYTSFKVSYEGKLEVALLADIISNKVKVSFQKAVYEKSVIDVSNDMKCNYPVLNGNRSNLELYLLKSLAEKESFENYLKYFTDPKSAVKYFIKECIEDYMRDTRRLSGFLHNNINEYKNIILNAINQSTIKSKKQNGNVDSWLDDFCSELGSKLSLSSHDLKSVKYQNITGIEFLKEAMTQSMDTVVQMCKKELSTCDMEGLKEQILEILTDNYPGCWEQCPFCGAVCTNTGTLHSTGHSVQFHRPAGFSGRTSWWFRHRLRIDICTSLVSSSAMFLSHNDKLFPTYYKNYAKEGPPYSTWSITPDNSALSYWKWVTCRFQSDIENYHEYKFETIPAQWKQISKADVISEIEKYLQSE